jgi:hypothetical protein
MTNILEPTRSIDIAPTSPTLDALEVLAALMPGQVARPGDPAY